jgi:hypothetical protein
LFIQEQIKDIIIIVSAIETSGYSHITKMGAYLFSVAGSGDHGHIEDSDLEKHSSKRFAIIFSVVTRTPHIVAT